MRREIQMPLSLYCEDGKRVCICCDRPMAAESINPTCGCVNLHSDADDDILDLVEEMMVANV